MSTLKICKLHFTSPLHIGDQKNDDYGNSLKTISSDTIYAAMTAVLATSGVSIPDNGDLGFTVSSLFPYYQQAPESTPVLFFPQPLQAHLPKLADLGQRKKVKKVKWLDASYFEKVLSGAHLFDGTSQDVCNIQGEYLSNSEVPSDFVSSQVIQRVTLKSRVGEDDALPYYIDRISFRDQSGLFFIYDGDETMLRQAMSLLSLEGIGTDRNVGNGFFDYELTTLDLILPAQSSHSLSMSLLIPESKEQLVSLLASDVVAYDLERRGGWITSYPFQRLRKNAIYGLVPGSVFARESKGLETIGRIVDLRPDIDFTSEKIHPIWRSGKSLLLPIIV